MRLPTRSPTSPSCVRAPQMRTPRSSASAAGTPSACGNMRRAGAATTDSESPAGGRRECPNRRLCVADGAVEGGARLREQPAPTDPLEIDHVVLHRDVLAIGEVVGDGGGEPRAVASERLWLDLDDLRAPPRRAAARRRGTDRGAERCTAAGPPPGQFLEVDSAGREERAGPRGVVPVKRLDVAPDCR